jgi:rubrerythrin
MNKSDKNQTGVSSNPQMAARMLAIVDDVPPTSTGTPYGDDAVRFDYTQAVEPKHRSYGSVPPPKPQLLTDQLGARLAFERTGVRLYEALISKVDALGSFKGGPDRTQLQALLNDEHCHFSLLHAAILELGGDPTVVTPAADLVGVIASGVLKVITDPRTTVLESLEAILVAELADTAGWNALTAIARKAGKKKLARSFAEAEQTEEKHRALVTAWIAAGQGRKV